MKFAIITQVPHLIENGKYLSYAPYVREMNIWLKYTDQAIVVAPLSGLPKTAVDMAYEPNDIEFIRIRNINLLGFKAILNALLHVPGISFEIFQAMRKADHIHLRCPGNIGLLGCLVQIFFPNKPKTAKYAGNWDPKAPQPWSYKWQRWILSNAFLTKNMQVLVYGEWPENSKNIKPFFTATYKESDKTEVLQKRLNSNIKMLFVGTLARGKRPLYAVQLVEKLIQSGHHVVLELYGEGKERFALEGYIAEHKLGKNIILKGNQPETVVRKAYQESHFLLLPSQSEGWPKVVAEAMFWRCLPIVSAVSCVPNMLGHGQRGILLDISLSKDAEKIVAVLEDEVKYEAMAALGMQWSRQFTFDVFETEIKNLLKARHS